MLLHNSVQLSSMLTFHLVQLCDVLLVSCLQLLAPNSQLLLVLALVVLALLDELGVLLREVVLGLLVVVEQLVDAGGVLGA